MNYSSYLGLKKCNNVLCTQGEPGPRGMQGPIGPTGPSGNNLNTFTINSSKAIYKDNNISWNINIPFIYGKQFTFTFNTVNSSVTNYIPTQPDYSLNTTLTYIFGTGQAVYQPYEAIINNVTVTKYGYIPSIISKIGTNSNFNFISTVDNINNNMIYQFIYYNNNNINFQNSIIKLTGTKC